MPGTGSATNRSVSLIMRFDKAISLRCVMTIEEAKDQVVQSLEKRGFLNSFKAEIRAAIFAVLHAQQAELPLEDSDADLLLKAITMDLLQTLKLNHTMSVFEAEAHVCSFLVVQPTLISSGRRISTFRCQE